jgi:SH3-like domain-containing protein
MSAMRVSVLVLLVAGAVLLGATDHAYAEKVRTNQSTKLHAGPGEQKKVLLTVKSGQNMTLLAQEGRWLKVRVQGRTGYVPRSKVDMADDGSIARNTRRRPFVDGRSRRRGFGGEAGPDDRVGADATGEGLDDDEEEADDEDVPAPKKTSKKPAKKTAAKSRASDDDEEDEPKRPVKAAAKARPSVDDDEDEDFDDDEEDDRRPIARVAKKVSIYEEADTESEELFVARPTDVLYPVETKGKWTAVENAEGDFGWVQTELLELEGGGGGGGGLGKRRIDAGARLGVMIIQQAMRTAGSTNLKVPDNYNIGTSAATISLGGTFLMPFKASYLLGADAAYDYSKTLFGGITYNPPDVEGQPPTPPVTTGITVHDINVRALAGYDLKNKRGMAVFGRLGYRYQSYVVADYADEMKNPARIPQEIIKAPTLGAALAMPRLTSKIGLRVAVDTILFGASLAQTKGLEDGSAPSLKAVTFGTAVTYKWKKAMDIAVHYDLRYMGIDFGPPLASSMRGHMGNNVTRTDIFHAVTAGVAKPF